LQPKTLEENNDKTIAPEKPSSSAESKRAETQIKERALGVGGSPA
jgi:hypothetical protein